MEHYFKFYNSLLWGLCSIVFGALLMYWQKEFLEILVIIMGWTAVAIAVIQFFGFLSVTKGLPNRWNHLPISSIIALIFGILFLAKPAMWVNIFMLIMGIIMALLAISQIVSMLRAQKLGYKVPWGFFVFPVLLLISGAVVLVEPAAMANWLVIFTGAWIIAYGISELAAYFTLNKRIEQ